MTASFDLACFGRVAVDLYGEQYAATLEEARSFRRYLGGSAGNLAVGAARAGLSVRMISRVGEDPMGRYLTAMLKREGVDLAALGRDPARKTALAFLGMEGAEAISLDFYRTDCADQAIDATDIPANFFERARALAVTGTSFAEEPSAVAARTVVEMAVTAQRRVILDIDFRRHIWAASAGGLPAAAARVRAIVPKAALIVGNLEELEVISNAEGLIPALRALRDMTDAPILAKLGATGAALVEGSVPGAMDDLHVVPSPRISQVNPVGAGDAFLANFLAAWLRGAPADIAVRRATAAGALVAARHACSAAMPYAPELDRFLESAAPEDPVLDRLHRALGRGAIGDRVFILACDHRVPFQKLMAETGRTADDVARFKSLVFDAAARIAAQRAECPPGLLMDTLFGEDVLNRAARNGWWVGRPLEVTGSRPLRLEADPDLGGVLASWHPAHVGKVLAWHHPDDAPELVEAQVATLARIQSACLRSGNEWMLEVVPPVSIGHDDETLLRAVEQLYELGLYPDYWKLPVFETDASWRELSDILTRHDSQCRGVIVLGLDRPLDELADGLRRAGRQPACLGFAIGRSIFGPAAQEWFRGHIDDAQAVSAMAERYSAAIGMFTGETAAQLKKEVS